MSKDSSLLTKIKELRQYCLEQLDANAGLEKDTEKDLRESKGREPTYWEVKCEQAYTDAKHGAYVDILIEVNQIIREHKELDYESLKSTVEEMKDEIEEIRASKDSEYLGNRLDEIKDNMEEEFETINSEIECLKGFVFHKFDCVNEKFEERPENFTEEFQEARKSWYFIRGFDAIKGIICADVLDKYFEIEEVK